MSYFAHAQTTNEAPASGFMSEYPAMKDLVYQEEPSNIYFGVGASPFGFVGKKVSVGLSAFQVHYIGKKFDLEIVNGGVQFSFGSEDLGKSQHFTLRTAPKWRLNSFLSVGLVAGYEVVSFPNAQVTIVNGTLTTSKEPFSSRGFFYGVIASQLFKLKGDSYLRLNEMVYKQNYSSRKTEDGWIYNYIDPKAEKLVEGGMVAVLDVSYLF